ncbi:MmgE/PrpD family protein [Zwartia vadi]|uniref:MmgE/PrpD family protein n=1 Tax=Zwartia vadi TaxID=3058168 RepID=UPI0025B390E4|nr:MmgE/PrpD family protein [Zwartia vadi]MDN3987632.1 MmgE/PrpD family protein [Zwartia vadi]
MNTSQVLCENVHASRWENIVPAVRHEAKRSLLNYFAVGFAGSHDPTIDKLVSLYTSFSANQQASIVGRTERTDMLNAAALNAMSANVFDYDDTHLQTVIHPTAPIAAALLAYAEINRVTGRDFLQALILGMEVECRVGNAISPYHYGRGWHITSTCGALGAAIAVGWLLRLSPQQLNWALGGAANQACGIVETLGTMVKSLSVGNAARNGMLSALLAAQDFDGPIAPLDGVRGFLNVMGEQPDLDCINERFGEHWEMSLNTYKPYPCGIVLNPVIEACLQLSSRQELVNNHGQRIESVEVTGQKLLRDRTDRPGVKSGRESQVSAQHAVPVSLLRGRAGLAEFSDEAVNDPIIRALGEKVRFTVDDTMSIDAAKVTLHYIGAPSVTVFVEQARGSTGRPLTDQDLEEKCKVLSAQANADCDVDRLIRTVWEIDSIEDAGTLMALARQS